MRLKELFHSQNAGVVVLDDEEVEVLIPEASHVEERANQETFRTDQAPYSTTVEDQDLEIWTKQPGNEVFRKAVEKWREECKTIIDRLRMNLDQQLAMLSQCVSRIKIHKMFTDLIIHALRIEIFRRMPYRWTWSPVFLEALFNLCLVFYQHRCLWRLCKAFGSDLNKRIYGLLQLVCYVGPKEGVFSFEQDTKEYDPSSNSLPKLIWILLAYVTEVFGGLLLFIFLIIFFVLYTWIEYLLERSKRFHFKWK